MHPLNWFNVSLFTSLGNVYRGTVLAADADDAFAKAIGRGLISGYTGRHFVRIVRV